MNYDHEGCGLPQTERRGDWMQTFTGRQYWPLDPRAGEVGVEDIAHHLSLLCRYCGACKRFYSVAEHSLGVLACVEADLGGRQTFDRMNTPIVKRLRLRALLDDAPEAYCHDIIRPIKRCIEGYADIEARNWWAIIEHFDLGHITHADAEIIKNADNAMLLAEQAVLMAPAPAKWSPLTVPAIMLNAARTFLGDGSAGYHAREAESEFLRTVAELQAA